MPKIDAGNESLLEVVPVASILRAHQSRSHPDLPTPTPSSPVEPPSAGIKPYIAISRAQAEHFLDSPRTMMGVKFTCTPPSEGDEDLVGEWKLVSHSVCIGDDDVVDDEYMIRLDAFKDGPVAMGRDEVQYLLAFSLVSR